MGNWNISVCGVGSHHNKANAHDANRMAAAFVKALRDAGHHVSHAVFTHGSADEITDPVTYLDDRDGIEGVPEADRKPRCHHPVGEGTCRLVQHHNGEHRPKLHWRSAPITKS